MLLVWPHANSKLYGNIVCFTCVIAQVKHFKTLITGTISVSMLPNVASRQQGTISFTVEPQCAMHHSNV